MIFWHAVVIGCLLPFFVTAAEVYGVFTDVIMPSTHPLTGVTGRLKWSLPAGEFSPGDTFKLMLPCVYIRSNAETIYLVAGGVKYGVCNDATKTPWSTTQSTFSCRLLAPVANNVSVRGTITFPMMYNVGGPTTEIGMKCARLYNSGTNTVTFSDGKNDLKATMNLENKPVYWEHDVGITYRTDIRDIVTIAWTTYDFCPKGYKSISLVASVVKGAITLDCPNSHAHATTDLNDWDKPRSKLNLPVSSSCNDKTYTATLKDIPRSRVAMDLKMNNKPGVDSISLDYTVKYTCAGTTKEITVPVHLTQKKLGQNYPNSYGDVFTSITKTYTGTTTQTKTLPAPNTNADRTITVEIDVPASATTISSTWTGTETTTVTRTASEGGIDTVIVEVPTPATTLTSTWTGTETTTVTQTASEGGTNTVIVVKPTTFSETTLYSTGTGTSEYTITETAASSGGTNTVIVVKPTTFSETTLFSTDTGTSEYTITETAASSGGTNTVIVVKPTTFSETTSTLTGTGTSEYTITETAASSGGINTVVVVKPTTFSETTLYSTGTGTSEYTITETAASSGGTNTVIVVKPTSLHMTFSLGVYWNTSSTASPNESISTGVITSTDLVFTTPVSGPSITSTVLCEECEQPIFTSEASIASKSSQIAPSGTPGREISITSVASSNHEEPTCTPCIDDGLPELLSPGRTQSRTRSSSNTSGTRDGSFSTGGSFSKGAQPTVSPDAYFPGSTLSFSSLASTALPSITVFSSQEGAATQSVSLVWALAFGIMLYFV